MKKITGIIPARFQSTRFPGKPLALILGKPMIQWVYEAAKKAKSLDVVIVATDDDRILNTCTRLKIPVVLSSRAHVSGTERVAEIAKRYNSNIIINIQGDEPLLEAAMIDALVKALEDRSVGIASLMTKIKDLNAINDRNRVKVVVDKNNFALYFSRSPIPSRSPSGFYQHIGIYGYKREWLFRLCDLPPSQLELAEGLEQLRALENGYKIRMIETPFSTLSVDLPEDIIKVEERLKNKIDE